MGKKKDRKRKREEKTTKNKKQKNEEIDVYSQIFGENTEPELKLQLFEYLKDGKTHLKLKDIQQFILSIFDEAPIPKWVQIKNKSKIEKVFLICVPGLDYDLYTKHIDKLQIFQELKSQACMTYSVSCDAKTSTNAFFHTILNVHRKPQKSYSEKSIKSTLDLMTEKIYKLEDFLLTEEELIENEFPLKNDKEKKEENEYVQTVKLKKPKHKAISMDCEMCLTEKGSELTRITLIGHKLNDKFESKNKLILDKFVKPSTKIIDYLTQYSGVTENHLKNVTTTLEDIQKELLSIISSDTVLIGHSLENDLKSVKMIHKTIIDTSVLYPMTTKKIEFGNLKKNSLKYLSIKYLKKTIQNSKKGHDSIEDAQSAFDLTLLKLKHGPDFGLPNTDENFFNLFSILHAIPKKSMFIDEINVINKFSTNEISSISCVDDKEITEKTVKQIKKESEDFYLIRLNNLTNEENEQSQIEKLNENLTRIFKEIPSKKSLFCIVSGTVKIW
eukprot:gene5940-9770_t